MLLEPYALLRAGRMVAIADTYWGLLNCRCCCIVFDVSFVVHVCMHFV